MLNDPSMALALLKGKAFYCPHFSSTDVVCPRFKTCLTASNSFQFEIRPTAMNNQAIYELMQINLERYCKSQHGEVFS
jgi:hypothetical protein